MPKVTRSPPVLQHTSSDSDVTKISLDAVTPTFVSQRNKRQRECSEEKFLSFKEEITHLISDWKNTQNSLLEKLVTEVATIKEQNNQIKKSNEDIEKGIEFLNNQYEDMVKKIENLEKERKQHLLQIASLVSRVEDMERSLKASTIEIRNVPLPTQRETKGDLCQIVQNTCKTLNVNVSQKDIRDVYRITTKSGKGTIIADITSVITKAEIIQGVKTYNKQHPEQKLNSAVIGLKGNQCPIYVSEALTSKARRLFFLARDLVRSNEYKFCWTSNGKVYLRKSLDATHIEVRDEMQLASLRSQK